MRIIFALFLALVCAGPSLAASPSEPSYRVLSGRAEFPWSEGLSIYLNTDENLCKEKYGQKWRQKCFSSPGRPGEAAKGITMTPKAAGRWQWTDSNVLRFIPSDGQSLHAGTVYKIDLSGLYLPPSVKLPQKEISVKTLPLAVSLNNLEFFINPAPDADHRLACAVEFSYPILANPEIKLISPQGLSFGEPEMVWNGERDKLNISWPIRKLPDAASQCSVLFPGMGQIYIDDSIIKYFPPLKDKNGSVFNKNIPGGNELFFIRSASLESRPDAGLNSHYILSLDASLDTRPEDLLKSLLIYELPQFNSDEGREPFNWRLAPSISPEILKKSRKLEAEPTKKGNYPESRLELRVPAEQGRYIICALPDGFKSASGQALAKPWLNISRAEPIAPEVGFLQPGNVLSLQGGGKLELYGREIDEIEWEVQLVRDPFLALLASSSWNPFEAPFGYLDGQPFSFTSSQQGKIIPGRASQGKVQFASLDLGSIMPELARKAGNEGPGGLALVTLKGKRRGKEEVSASRLALLSEIGLIVKRRADGGLHIFALNLADNKPEANLDAKVLGANGFPVAFGKTDDEGQLLIPSLSGLKNESAPTAIVAGASGKGFAWLPLNDSSRELNYSNFNISGSHIGADDLNVFIFSQRDVYRPGEEMRFGCLARKGNFDLLPPDLPLYAEIMDPRGALAWSGAVNLESPGLSDLSWTIPGEAATGRYIFNIRTAKNGPILRSKVCRVEEFQPETLRLRISPPLAAGWLHIKDKESGPEVSFALQNLYGSPAAGHKVKAELELAPAQFRFKGYEDYIFTDAVPGAVSRLSRRLPELATDKEGQARAKLPLDLLGQSSALATVSAEGFTAGGGRAVVAQSSFLTSPMPYIIGYRPQGDVTDFKYIHTGAKAGARFLALNPELEKIDLKDLNFSLSRARMVSSLLSDGNGGYKYDDSPVEELIRQWRQDCGKSGLSLDLDTSEPGDYVLRIKDKNGLPLSSVAYSVIGESLEAPASNLQVSKIRMRLNKNSVELGENVELALSLPYDGSGLISLEREGVEAWQWFEAKAGESVHNFRIPENFEGKGWIVVNFIRGQDSPRIYVSPLSYVVEGVEVNPARRDMGLKIVANDKIEPGKNLKIHLSARENGKAILFAVDEGVLRLTGYAAPDPIKALLGDRALDVATIQALDLLMPVKGLEKRLSAFGGGMDGAAFSSRFQNPFKRKNEAPVAAWFSNINVGPQGADIVLPIPEYYNGQIRIMAVGVSERAAGSAIAQTIAAAPFLMSPQMPMHVSPGDTFRGRLLLANNGESDEIRNISIEDSGAFKIIRTDPPKVSLERGGEALWDFELTASDSLGESRITFMARDGEKTNRRDYSVSIRPASGLITSVQAGGLDQGGALPPSREVYPEQSSSVATISTLPLALAQGMGQYLRDYPFGCTEQLVSRSFGALLLKPWLNESKDEKTLSACLDVLRSRMTGQGLALWPNGEGSLALTSYAADFLLVLRSKTSINVEDLLDALCESLAENCALNESSMEAARASAYAIWVLTREGRVTAQLLEQLLQSLRERQISGWQNDLTALLIAASQKEMRMKNILRVDEIRYNPAGFFDEFSQYAMHMTLLSAYFPEALDELRKREFFEECSAKINNGNFATFSAAQAIRAIATLGKGDMLKILGASLRCPDRKEESFTWAGGSAFSVMTDFCPQYEILGDPQGLFWQISVTGYDRAARMEAESNGIIMEKEYMDLDGNPVGKASLGQEILVRLRARSESGPLKDCVIADILPGGLEPVFEAKASQGQNDNIKYIDRREDRMLVFADIDVNPVEFVYRARAIAAGSFAIPPARAEAMYNRYISGQSASGALKIDDE